jgi:hypothetical protein
MLRNCPACFQKHRVPGRLQMSGHRRTHKTETDKSEIRHGAIFPFARATLPLSSKRMEERPMRCKTVFAGAALVLAAGLAFAQAPPTRLRGTVEAFDGKSLTLKGEDGKSNSFAVAPNFAVFNNKKATVADIKPGDFVASAAVKGTDGKLHSTEVRIFPEAMRGVGEGQRPMDMPNTMMTNATVTEVVGANVASGTLRVKYKDGVSELVVDPGVAVTAIVPAEKSEVKPGAKLSVNYAKGENGAMTATRATLE